MRSFRETRDILASKAKLEFTLQELLPKDVGFSVLAGQPGQGKTNLALNIAAGIATGRNPVTGLEVHKGKVGYVLFEAPGLAAKLDRLQDIYGDESGIEDLYLEVEAPIGLFSLKKKLITNFSGMDLGILDPLNMIGVGNLSNPHDMAENVKVIMEISRESGAHILVVHHLRKPSNDPRYKFIPQGLSDVKGANDLEAGTTSIMILRDEYQTDLFAWGHGKGFPKKRGNDYVVLDLPRAQASEHNLGSLGLFFDRPSFSFKRSEGMISTAAPGAAKTNGVHADEP